MFNRVLSGSGGMSSAAKTGLDFSMNSLAFMRPSEDNISKRDGNRGLDKAPSLLLNNFHRCALKQTLSNFDELALKDIGSGGLKEFCMLADTSKKARLQNAS
jgi:hypothetical protein